MKVCIICRQSRLDCNCDEDDLKEYVTEEGEDLDTFEQFVDCEDCED